MRGVNLDPGESGVPGAIGGGRPAPSPRESDIAAFAIRFFSTAPQGSCSGWSIKIPEASASILFSEGRSSRTHCRKRFAMDSQPSNRSVLYSDDVDFGAMSGGSLESLVAGQQRSFERLGQRQVDRVVCGQVVAELPSAWEEEVVGIARDR